MEKFYITAAIDYVNSRPHLGTAYEKITADVIARYRRLTGTPTRFLMGNDEFSQNVFRRARDLGLSPDAYCDQMEGVFRDVWDKLDVSYDDFIRTTQPRHRAAVTALVERVYGAGDVYEGFYEGWYCDSCEAFKQDKDLVEGLCPAHHKKPEWIKEKNHFFRLSRYRDALLEYYDTHPEFVQPEIRRNEIRRLVEGGLDDVSISRAGQLWGVPVPFDPDSVVYVWFDALTNYLSAVGYATDEAAFARWWPAHLHIVGKDITRFHCVLWPAMLMSAGLPLPTTVFGHGWVHFKGRKMSKSLGTVVDPLDAVERFGPDPLRLYLVKEIAYGQDGDFSWERFEDRYNVDLANNLGNLVSRLTAMVRRYRDGRLRPTGSGGALAERATTAVASYRAAMDRYALHEAAGAAFGIVDATNEFIAEWEPWALARDEGKADRLTEVLQSAAEAVRIAAVLLGPIVPSSGARILERLGEPGSDGRQFDEVTRWNTDRDRTLVAGEALWPRLDSENRGAAAGATATTSVAETAAGGKEGRQGVTPTGHDENPPAAADAARISFDALMQVDLRTATIVAAEPVPKSKKLLKLEIDLGTERRTLVAGIAGAYAPERLVGRTIIVVANLQPATLMGVESNGMLLAASGEDGVPRLLAVDGTVPPGTRIR